jgi:hypothetical protein
VVDAILGVYLDATHGFALIREHVDGIQKELTRISRGVYGDTEQQDGRPYIYGQGHPDEAPWPSLQVVTQGALKERNAPGSRNHRFIGNMCLVALYQYWEDQYRSAIGEALGTTVQSNVMGDVRNLRHSIIHNGGRAIEDVARNRNLKWFEPGDEVFITTNHLVEIVTQLGDELSDLTGLTRAI